MRVLLLEDEYVMRKIVEEFLKNEGYEVDCFNDGNLAFSAILDGVYDILLLDVRVPNKNGFEILKAIRSDGILTPAIFITSLKDSTDLQMGYDAGCCDYIRKPFDLMELRLRIAQAIRSNCFKTVQCTIELSDGYIYDTKQFVLRKDNDTVQLTKLESSILELLIKNRTRVVTHEQFQNEIWQE